MPQPEPNYSIVRLPTGEEERSESSAGPTGSVERVQLELASTPSIRDLVESIQSLQQNQQELQQYITSVDEQITAGFADVRNEIDELRA